MKNILRTLLMVLCALGLLEAQANYDLLLKGGHVIDPKNQINGVMDVAIAGGKIASVAPRIDAAQARKVIDVSGLYVTPGIVDIHIHAYYTPDFREAWAGDNSISPDGFTFRTGVTTAVDAGSAGWRNFPDFRYRVMDRAQTRLLAMINIVGLGMMTDIPEQNPRDMDPQATAEMARKHRDVIVAVKSAHYQGPDWVSIERAVEAGTLADIPVMVDFGYFLPQRPYQEMVLKKLRPGDISTHMYRNPVPILDEHGKLLPYLNQARARGVKFDVGHGGGSFWFRLAAPAIAQGWIPDSISTDLHRGSMNAGMMDMPTTMSKILNLGVSLPEVIRLSTWNPANQIKRPDLGHLSAGAAADVAVLRLLKGEFGFSDARGAKLTGSQRLQCEMTLRDGQVVWDWNGRAGKDWREMGNY